MNTIIKYVIIIIIHLLAKISNLQEQHLLHIITKLKYFYEQDNKLMLHIAYIFSCIITNVSIVTVDDSTTIKIYTNILW